MMRLRTGGASEFEVMAVASSPVSPRRDSASSRLPSTRRIAAAFLALVAMCTVAVAEDPQITSRRAAERKSFTDAEIIDGFFKVTFGAEFHVAGSVDRIRKYDGPVRVYIDNRATPDRTAQVGIAIADIRSRVRNLDITMTDKREAANMIVSLVNDRDLARMIRAIYGIDRTAQVGIAIADIRSRVRNLDITMTDKREAANMIVSLVNDRDLARMIRAIYGIDRARRIQKTL